MEINLRRASVVQNAIREAITERASRLTGNQNVELWRFAGDAMYVEQARAEQLSLLAGINQLETILFTLRLSVGQANAVNGVNSVLTEQAVAQARVARLQRLLRNPPAVSASQLAEQVKHAQANNEKNAYHSRDEIAVNLFTEQDLQEFREQMVQSRRRLNELSDMLVAANVKSTVVIAHSDWQFLEQRGIV
tara:strand:- start:3737 stop:4312 length:576 start_codon:yes stop_codon:yes gene_type:complete